MELSRIELFQSQNFDLELLVLMLLHVELSPAELCVDCSTHELTPGQNRGRNHLRIRLAVS